MLKRLLTNLIYKETIEKNLETINPLGYLSQHIDCIETIQVLLQFYKPEYLCDIGANEGHWTHILYKLNPILKHAVLFEPQKSCQKELKALPLPGVKKLVYNFGLGNKEAKGIIKGGTPSASFLRHCNTQIHYFPTSINNKQQKTRIRRLDNIYLKKELPYPDVIKIDVQGYELNVLEGAINVLKKARYLVLELSFRKFYKNQPPLWTILKLLEEHDYVMVAKGYEWRSEKNPAEILQMDGIFRNKKIIK